MDLKALDAHSSREDFVRSLSEKVYDNEVRCHGCAQVVVQSFMDQMGVEDPLLSKASSPFFAGLALTGQTCGALIGSLMMLGMVFGREDINQGLPGLLENVRPMRKLIKHFSQKNQEQITCREITGVDIADPEQSQEYFQAGGLQRCAQLMADTTAEAAGLIWDHRQKQKAEKEMGGEE
ncbi:MAG: C-GCAxxG-C-C family protein [Desulfarculaceae bacterium]|nr:C-GCAxxG-C-C family protein [Desulfarculaceae bacterium]MCF8049531.1 C-GCAxxG-C-C family protein [Desulfarculaceae bacterium]